MTSLAAPAMRRPRAHCAPKDCSPRSRGPCGGLPSDQERQLAARILAGDLSARDELVLGNLALARFYALKYAGYRTHDLDLDDLEQAGAEGLVVAANQFDPGRFGTRFSTYAAYWIRQRIWLAVINTGEMVRIPSHIHTQREAAAHRKRIRGILFQPLCSAESEQPLERVLELEKRDRVRARLGRLKPHQRELLSWYFSDHQDRRQAGDQVLRRHRVIAAKKLLAVLRAELNPQEGSTHE